MKKRTEEKRNQPHINRLEHRPHIFEEDKRKPTFIEWAVGFVIRKIQRNIRIGIDYAVGNAGCNYKQNRKDKKKIRTEI